MLGPHHYQLFLMYQVILQGRSEDRVKQWARRRFENLNPLYERMPPHPEMKCKRLLLPPSIDDK